MSTSPDLHSQPDARGGPTSRADSSEGEDAYRAREELRERYQELLQEFRIVLPGVQIFFAFLLTAPFSSTFAELDRVSRAGYAVSIMSAALAVVVLETPVAYHHVQEHEARRSRLTVTIRLKFVGLTLTGLAASAGLFVVVRFVFGSAWGWVTLVFITVCWSMLWFVLPIRASDRFGSGRR